MASAKYPVFPESVRHGLRAIVFDTNSFPRGGLDLEHLTVWGHRAAEEGFEVWVPEPVLWELAEHASASWEAWRASTNQARKAMQAAGLDVPAESPYSTREEVMAAVEGALRSLAPSVRILELDGDLAVEALRDQVQIRSPAKKKSDVKTGAADSAWLRQVLRTADNKVDSFVIVGADADVYQAFSSWGLPKPHMVPLHALHESLFVVKAPSEEIRNTVVEFLQGVVGLPLGGGRTPEGNLTMGEVDLGGLIHEWELDQVRNVELGHVLAFLGMNQVKISRRGLVTAQVFLLVDAEYSGWRINEDGTSIAHTSTLPQVWVRDVLSFTLNEGLVTLARSETGQAMAFRADDMAHNDEGEAFDEFVDGLSLIPGLDGELGGGTYDSTNARAHVNGFDLELVSEREGLDQDGLGGDSEWCATVTLSKEGWSESLEVRCVWDSIRVPCEMPDLMPAYVLITDDPADGRIPADWAAPAWAINHIWPRPPVVGPTTTPEAPPQEGEDPSSGESG
ncbi:MULTISPECIES: hypothetical protein [unclassified Streptomyces]|uniref:hypothetical protein n=1 Tax=unclassified Streptomyces TaxID=2593676 RepID=UPI00114D1BA2|nr:hypothetical protein [Streptomyces sp. BvitLS-983]MYX84748.1 hypothetical protein [Streptomyces sp. SID4915]